MRLLFPRPSILRTGGVHPANKLNGDLDSFTPAEYLAGAAKEYRIVDVNPAGPTIPGATYVDLLSV